MDCRPNCIQNFIKRELFDAIKNHDLHKVTELYLSYYSSGDSIDSLLWAAVYNNSFDIVKYLCEKGVVVTSSVINLAAFIGDLEVIKYLCGKIDNTGSLFESAILTASIRGHLDVVIFFHNIGVNIHTEKDLALCYSVYWEKIDVAIYLLQNGAKCNFKHHELHFVKENNTYHMWHYNDGVKQLSEEIQIKLQKYNNNIHLTKNARR